MLAVYKNDKYEVWSVKKTACYDWCIFMFQNLDTLWTDIAWDARKYFVKYLSLQFCVICGYGGGVDVRVQRETITWEDGEYKLEK